MKSKELIKVCEDLSTEISPRDRDNMEGLYSQYIEGKNLFIKSKGKIGNPFSTIPSDIYNKMIRIVDKYNIYVMDYLEDVFGYNK